MHWGKMTDKVHVVRCNMLTICGSRWKLYYHITLSTFLNAKKFQNYKCFLNSWIKAPTNLTAKFYLNRLFYNGRSSLNPNNIS